MIVYLFIFTIFTLLCLFFIYNHLNKNYSRFNAKQKELINAISDENKRLKNQKQKNEIVDDYKKTMNSNNQELISKIVVMNTTLFKELNKNK